MPLRGPSAHHPGAAFAEVVNVDSGLCLDIENGIMGQGTDVITALCAGALTQQWRLDTSDLLHSFADEDFCLDSRGATDDGVGIWTCSSANGRHGENLRFTVDASGQIRPQIDLRFAVTPPITPPATRSASVRHPGCPTSAGSRVRRRGPRAGRGQVLGPSGRTPTDK